MLGSVGDRGRKFSKPGMSTAMLAALVLALAGCPSTRRPSPAVPASTPVGEPSAPVAEPSAEPGVRRYRVDPGASLLVIVAERGGALAAAGHNHVIASHDLAGTIDLREPLSASRFEVHLPVERLTVDEPQLRAARGTDFEREVPDAAREGTRRNMLGEGVLDAVRYPSISARSVSLGGGPEHFAARVEFTVRGEAHTLDVPVRITFEPGGALRVAARFPLAQSAIGLTPFSTLLGALRVEDILGVELDLTARRVP